MFKMLVGTLAGVELALSLPAQARDVPPAAALPVFANQAIHGRVTRFSGGYAVSVRDENGAIVNVTLHPGTVITPTGLTLTPGMVVSIIGHAVGSSFAANEIDTPYQVIDGFAYYGGQVWDAAGPGASLDMFVDDTGWGRAPHDGGARDGRHGGPGGEHDRGGNPHHGGGGAGHGGGGAGHGGGGGAR